MIGMPLALLSFVLMALPTQGAPNSTDGFAAAASMHQRLFVGYAPSRPDTRHNQPVAPEPSRSPYPRPRANFQRDKEVGPQEDVGPASRTVEHWSRFPGNAGHLTRAARLIPATLIYPFSTLLL
jgi:hypothetical protein